MKMFCSWPFSRGWPNIKFKNYFSAIRVGESNPGCLEIGGAFLLLSRFELYFQTGRIWSGGKLNYLLATGNTLYKFKQVLKSSVVLFWFPLCLKTPSSFYLIVIKITGTAWLKCAFSLSINTANFCQNSWRSSCLLVDSLWTCWKKFPRFVYFM